MREAECERLIGGVRAVGLERRVGGDDEACEDEREEIRLRRQDEPEDQYKICKSEIHLRRLAVYLYHPRNPSSP